MLPEQQQRILGYFIEEARDHLNTIEQGLLNLQGTLNDPEMINEVFRAAHSIKGGAAMLGLSSIQRTAHRLEDCFKLLKEHPVQVDQKLESLFLGASDTLKSLLEHLQGPFGLSEEKASELMLEAEPVFKWLQEHLDSLVESGGVSTEGDTGNAVVPTDLSTKSNIPLPSTGDGLVNLQNQTLQTLREMLQLFKQETTSQNRQELQNCTQKLLSMGKVLNLHNWCNLCETAQNAIANPDNSYLVLAKIVITQIKQSLELAVAGRDEEIIIPGELEALVAVPEIELLEINSLQENSTAKPVKKVNTPEVTSNANDAELNLTELDPASFDSVEKVNPIVADSLVSNTLENINLDEIVEVANNKHLSDDNSNKNPNKNPSIHPNTDLFSPAAQAKIPNIPEHPLQFDFDQFYDEEDELSLDSSEPPCPEVGIAELNTLADLFEGEAPDLEKTWEKEEILDAATIHRLTTENNTEEQQDTDSEFIKDILSDNDNNYGVPSEGNKEDLTLVQLFGDFLDEEDFAEKQGTLSNEQSSQQKLGDELSEMALNPNSLSNSHQFETASQNIKEDFEQKIVGKVDEEIESLLSLTLDDEELEPNSDLPFALPAESIAEVELSNPQTKNLDQLFLHQNDNVESVDDIVTIDAHQSEAILGHELVTDEDLLLENLLFGNEKNTTTNIEDLDNNNIFDEINHQNNHLNPNFSVSDTDIDNWWKQENLEVHNSNIILPPEQDVVEELEANLSVDKEDMFSLGMGNDNFDLEDLDFDLASEEEFTLMFYDEDTNDLFGKLSSNQPIISSTPGDWEFSPQEIHNLSQQPEELELFPEFTGSLAENLSETSESEPSLPEEYTDLSTEEMTKLSGGFAFINDGYNNSKNPDIIDELFVSSTEENINLEKPETETTVIQALDANSENTELEIYEHLDNFFSSDELKHFNTHLDSEVLDSEVINSEVLDSEVLGSEVLEAKTAGSELTDTREQNFSTKITENEVIQQTETDVVDELAHLEELLDEKEVSTPTLENDDFAALETLLATEAPNADASDNAQSHLQNATNSNIQKSGENSTSSNIEDEFSDLQKLLDDVVNNMPSAGKIQKNNTKGRQISPNRRLARFEQLMKVPVKHLDDMSNLVGELVVNRNTLEQDQDRLRQSLDNLLHQVHYLSDVGSRMQELYERSLLEASLLASRHKSAFDSSDGDRGLNELEMDRFTPFHTLSQEMIELIVRVRESSSDIEFVIEETERVARQFRQVTTQLQEGLTRSRMVPFAEATDRLKRGVRDNAIKCGKQVELVIEGQDTLIDKMILEHLTNPLTHMLNNAIAHGIETPEERQTKGKSPGGVITICALYQGNQTVISVSDDGAGIDPERVKEKAIGRGLIGSQQAQTMSSLDVYELLFEPGFSTKDQADDLAGRGVGMDIIRTEISEIRGTVSIDSSIGKGTSLTIRLPVTLSICKALCCVSERARIAFPMDGIEDTLDIPVKKIQTDSEGKQFISWRGTKLPFKPLKELLTYNRQLSRGNVYGGNRDDDMVSVIVVRSANKMIALQIDQVLSEQEIVIKQFEGPAPKPFGVAGATVLGDGRIMAIADVLEILDIFEGRTSKQNIAGLWEQNAISNPPDTTTDTKVDPTVLIIDDSITVRELLSLTFSKAGYRVEQARDGQEAWDKLRSGLPCDIIFCDIEMPRCDGLELLSRIQKDDSLNSLPIAMLTSRGADKHRQMAVELGASGYFTKPYLEEALLEAAGRMLKGEKLVGNG